MNNHTTLVTLTGPSGSGKTELLNRLVKEFGYTDITSHTTRAPREGEIDGESYHFTTEEEFNSMKNNYEFIEHIEFKGFQYGVSLRELQWARESGKIPVLIVEPMGLKQIKAFSKDKGIVLIPMYITHSIVTLINRYLNRIKNDDLRDDNLREFHAKRISSINDELGWWKQDTFLNTYVGDGDIASRVNEDIKYWVSRYNDNKG